MTDRSKESGGQLRQASTLHPASERILPYDALRVFALLCVLGIHALMQTRAYPAAPHLMRLLDQELSFIAVPLLVFISGALVWAPEWHEKYGAFLKKRFMRVGLPYIIWFLCYAVVVYLRQGPGEVSAAWLVKNFFSGNLWFHLYFIPMIFTFYLLTPLASKVLHSAKYAPELLFLVLVLAKVVIWPAVSPLLRAGVGAPLWSQAAHDVAHLPEMALGAWFALRFQKIRRVRRAPVSAQALVIPLEAVGRSAVASRTTYFMIGALSFIAFFSTPYLKKIQAPLKVLASASFGIYLLHPLILLAIQALVKSCGATALWVNGWFVFGVFAVLLAASAAIAWGLSRSRATAWLIGV